MIKNSPLQHNSIMFEWSLYYMFKLYRLSFCQWMDESIVHRQYTTKYVHWMSNTKKRGQWKPSIWTSAQWLFALYFMSSLSQWRYWNKSKILRHAHGICPPIFSLLISWSRSSVRTYWPRTLAVSKDEKKGSIPDVPDHAIFISLSLSLLCVWFCLCTVWI